MVYSLIQELHCFVPLLITEIKILLHNHSMCIYIGGYGVPQSATGSGQDFLDILYRFNGQQKVNIQSGCISIITFMV